MEKSEAISLGESEAVNDFQCVGPRTPPKTSFHLEYNAREFSVPEELWQDFENAYRREFNALKQTTKDRSK